MPVGRATPYKLQSWAQYLASHPDKGFAAYILQGLANGFHIGFDRKCLLRPSHGNLSSTSSNPEVVVKYVEAERRAGRFVGPIPPVLQSQCHVSPIGVIPKPHQPGKWRLIVDLSSPTGHSINDGIDQATSSMWYASIDQAVGMIQQLGKGTLLSKLDLKSAYRMIPVHPDDQPLLGISWGASVYLDAALPFGLRSAPKIFSAVADGLTWAMWSEGIPHLLHYLDDFLFLDPPTSSLSQKSIAKALAVCEALGVPVAPDKVMGPSKTLAFLGIQIDTAREVLSLPHEKLLLLQQTIRSWQRRKRCSKRELLSLIGQLQHAATVVRPGRTFVRWMIDLSMRFEALDHPMRINLEFRSDLQWWAQYFQSWNGIGFFRPQAPTAVLVSDASGSCGCGAYSLPEWFQLQWPSAWLPLHIAAKELLPILLGAALWGPAWSGQRVLCKCDNMAVVTIINTGAARDHLLMHLIRCLFFYSAHYQFTISAVHLPGRDNRGADALSRNQLDRFFLNCPQANPTPLVIPAPLLSLAVFRRPDWTSKLWKQLFASTLRTASHSQRSAPIDQPNSDTSNSASSPQSHLFPSSKTP